MLSAFQQQIQTLLPEGGRLLLAVSGGVDSVTLAHLCRAAGCDFGVAHCNFRLRGAESDADEAFVRDLAAGWDAPFHTRFFDTKTYADHNGLSTQMAARALRYEWFEQIRSAHGYAAIATAHHLEDSIETALLYFLRGAGLSGLAGIPPRNGAVIRPLLFATRADILAYAAAQGLHWREDSSNASDAYARNAVRHHLLPPMREIHPAFPASAAQTLRLLRAADANLQFLLRRLLGEPDAGGVYRLAKKILAELPAPAEALFDLLQPFGFLPEQTRQVVGNLDQTGLEWYSPKGYRLLNDRSELLLTSAAAASASLPIAADDLLVSLPDGGRLVLTPAEVGLPWPTASETALVDAEKLRFPLLLRRRKPGDHFQPLGMGGKTQTLQDFFVNQKRSRLEKENAWVLENGDGALVWVVGMRLDERFKIEASTSKLLKITWVKPS